MFSKLTDTVKRAGKALAGTVSSYARQFGRAIGKAACDLAGRFAAGAKVTGRFFKECFCAFGRLMKGCGAWIRQFFIVKKQNGCRAAFRAQWAALKQARSRHARLLSRGAVVAVPLMLMVLVGVTAPVWANFTLAKRVVYAQTVLGDILDAKTYESAKDYFIASVVGDDGADYLEEYSLNTVYVMKKQVLSAETLAEQMLRNTKSLVSGYGLYVEDQLALVSESSAPFYTQLYSVLDKAKNGNAAAQSAFVQSVEVREGFYPADDCVDTAAVAAAFTENTLELSIKTTVVEQYDKTVAYSVNKTNTDALTLGKTKVVTKGQNGTNRITARVTYVDGNEVERIITDTQVVEQPVAQQVLVGTKKAVARSASSSSKVMLWPIPKSVKYRISSEFNEDRTSHYHQGIDIACDKGTPIFAAMAGTVTVAKSSGSYGKHIMINHGNNVVTVYAHCSAIYVSVGDKVAKGEQIAAVGSTGRSTGNHVHFEVRINGKQYNPMYYLDK